MRHEDLQIDGIEYKLNNLTHLNIKVTLEGRNKNPELEISLTFFFSNHCYTEGIGKNEDPSEYFLLLDHNQRKFCINQYQMSLQLPEFIKTTL